MKIKKNGKVINLTESDIRKLSKVLITEQNSLDTLVNIHKTTKKVIHELKGSTPKELLGVWERYLRLGDINLMNNPLGVWLPRIKEVTQELNSWVVNDSAKISKSLGNEYTELLKQIAVKWKEIVAILEPGMQKYRKSKLPEILGGNTQIPELAGLDNKIGELNGLWDALDDVVKNQITTDKTKEWEARYNTNDEDTDNLNNTAVPIPEGMNKHNIRIKKNGKVINLTESDIKKLSKSLITEQDVITLEEKIDENTAAIYELKKWTNEMNEGLDNKIEGAILKYMGQGY